MMGPSKAEHDAQILGELTERVWASRVEGVARMYGWTWYHTHRSDRSNPGWPDYVFARAASPTGGGNPAGPPARIVIIELKTMRGRVSPPQRVWLTLLDLAGIECGVARPDRLDDLVAVLGPRATPLRYHDGWDK